MQLATEPPSRDPQKIADAARQFESLLIAQMVRSMREAECALSGGEDSANATAMEMAEQQFSQVLAANGGLGLASLVVKGLEPRAQ
jgi:Rod binding domain-containing protein